MPRRTLQRLAVVLAVLVPVLFVAGIWLGGHPSSLPEPLRDALVDDQTATLNEGLDVIEQDYYRKVDRDTLVTTRSPAPSRACATASPPT